MEGIETKHESFGMAGFSRSSIGGQGIPLFGSSILHNNVITFHVYRGAVTRRLEQDWYHADDRKAIVEVTMSQAQFAEMITSMNMGDGVPVTLSYVDGVRMPDCPYENKRMQSSNEFKQRMKDFGDRITSYRATMMKKVEELPKKDQDEIKNMIDSLAQEVRSNIPFYEDQFTRQMNKTVTEAKAEVEAFVANKIHSAGIEAIKENYKMIE